MTGADVRVVSCKYLLNKQTLINEVIGKANKLYDKQMGTGKVVKFCCDFKALEKVVDLSKNI